MYCNRLDEDELRRMSTTELNDMISAVMTQNRTLVSLCDDLKRDQNMKTKEADALENQLNRGIRLPYLVASISEVPLLDEE